MNFQIGDQVTTPEGPGVDGRLCLLGELEKIDE
jgi:hypothetical protein